MLIDLTFLLIQMGLHAPFFMPSGKSGSDQNSGRHPCRSVFKLSRNFALTPISCGARQPLLLLLRRFERNRCAPPAHLRRTIVQLPHKFFENTRDGGNGDLNMVSTRLPKNF
jgi:hypothetical protein